MTIRPLALLELLLFTILSSGPVQADDTRQTIRMMSFNIFHGEGMDGVIDTDRQARIIRRLAPDVVAIQEVDSATRRVEGRDILRKLASECLMHPLFVPAIDFMGGKYGIGILSRERPIGYRTVPLPGGKEARILVVVEFARYYFCCTHLSTNPQERAATVALLNGIERNREKPLFLAGDLNSAPDSPVMQELGEHYTVLTDIKQATYPANQPRTCIDYILAEKKPQRPIAVLNRGVVKDTLASDHQAVYVTVRLSTPAGEIARTSPYLQNPVDRGITVSWLTRVPVYAWVEYGTDTTRLQTARTLVDGQAVANNHRHKIRLDNLTPGETYYYRTCSREILSYQAYSKVFGETAYSGFNTFSLPEEETDTFTMLIFNDLHKRHATLDALYEQVKELPYNLVVFNGDCIDDPANETEAVRSLSYYNEKVGADRVPVIYLRGNHEIRNAYSIELRDLFDYVGNKTYAAFNWGDTRLVMLDCGEDKPDDHWVYYGLNDFTQLRKDQVDFLKKEIASKAFRKAGKRVLIHHIPIYGNRGEGYNPCLELWDPVLKKAPFQVALNGHTHRYAYHPKGSVGNNFPVVVGGGPSADRATVMVVQRKGDTLTLRVINGLGETLLEAVY